MDPSTSTQFIIVKREELRALDEELDGLVLGLARWAWGAAAAAAVLNRARRGTRPGRAPGGKGLRPSTGRAPHRSIAT